MLEKYKLFMNYLKKYDTIVYNDVIKIDKSILEGLTLKMLMNCGLHVTNNLELSYELGICLFSNVD